MQASSEARAAGPAAIGFITSSTALVIVTALLGLSRGLAPAVLLAAAAVLAWCCLTRRWEPGQGPAASVPASGIS